ncbi:AMP-binding protein [Paracoccus cavernae]|uniref:AMP-binding protein n=1 Tax=Paracoccus cavernae TaxID=1571207 RepID=A0ABT8DDR1_9RHOB|nr:AMP-binding protein [Paracoccus cavernae]MDN3714201.1 AMP-binding protein [Paracoccus cavernae]
MLFPQFLAETTVILFNGTGFDADLHLRLIAKLGVTTFCAPPTVYRVFAQMDLSGYDLASIRRSLGAGEPLNPEVIRFWQDHTGTLIADGYGQTETLNIIGNFPRNPSRSARPACRCRGSTCAWSMTRAANAPRARSAISRCARPIPGRRASFRAITRRRAPTAKPSATAGITPAIPRGATRTAISGSWAAPTT